MTHNLDLGPDAQANHALAVLRGMEFDGALAAGHHLVPGVFFTWDDEADLRLQAVSRPGQLIDLSLNVARPGKWMSLHVALGPADLTGLQAVGLICRSASPYATTFQPCLRSGQQEGGFVDHFFHKRVLTHSQPSLHMDAHLLGPASDLPRTAPWRELVLFFRPETSRIDLQDMRLFMV